MEVVAQNSEATLAFRALAALIIRYVGGMLDDEDVDLLGPMLRCIDALEANHEHVLALPDLRPYDGDEDEIINMIIRGVLQMVACILQQQNTEKDEYQNGLTELAHGVVRMQSAMVNERLKQVRRRKQ